MPVNKSFNIYNYFFRFQVGSKSRPNNQSKWNLIQSGSRNLDSTVNANYLRLEIFSFKFVAIFILLGRFPQCGKLVVDEVLGRVT